MTARQHAPGRGARGLFSLFGLFGTLAAVGLVLSLAMHGRQWMDAERRLAAAPAPSAESTAETASWQAALLQRRQARMGVASTLALGVLGAAFAAVALRRLRAQRQQIAALEALADDLRRRASEAESARRAQSRFLGQVSDEIRTPLQSLRGMLLPLQASGLTAHQAQQLRLAAESADHLLALLNDLLDLSQLASGRMTLHPAPLELRALLQQIEALMRPQAAARSLALHLDAEPAVPGWIIGDATRIRQVLSKLLTNAIRFSERGSVSLDVRVQAGAPARLVFVVTDTGVGMDAQTLARLFSPPAGDDGTPPPPGRPGMGLEISRQLAQAMDGELSVHSAPGEGSRFRFEIPLLAAEAPAAARAPTPRTDVALRSLTVLVAEDHPVNRQYLAALLEALHHEAHFVANGEEAVAAVQQRRFDLVLMDLHMPRLDGIGATQAIRALPDRAAATVPIVALTADAFPDTRDRCLIAGMNDFLTKPVSPQGLSSALRRLYGQEAADAAAPADVADAAPLLPDVELVNRSALDAAMHGIAPERLAEMIRQFLDQGPQTVDRLRRAVRDGQPLELRMHAHAACSAALTLGLTGLAQTAQALHEGAAHLPAHEVAHLVQRFEDLLPRTRAAVQTAGLAA
jgi:signal transduction histidine kinase/CheY-like chemotaxis protein